MSIGTPAILAGIYDAKDAIREYERIHMRSIFRTAIGCVNPGRCPTCGEFAENTNRCDCVEIHLNMPTCKNHHFWWPPLDGAEVASVTYSLAEVEQCGWPTGTFHLREPCEALQMFIGHAAYQRVLRDLLRGWIANDQKIDAEIDYVLHTVLPSLTPPIGPKARRREEAKPLARGKPIPKPKVSFAPLPSGGGAKPPPPAKAKDTEEEEELAV